MGKAPESPKNNVGQLCYEVKFERDARHRAVLEVLDGSTVVAVAARFGVSRHSVHSWSRRYATQGLAGLADRSSRPDGCAHQMAPGLEARVVEMRLAHLGWGPGTSLSRMAAEGVGPHANGGYEPAGADGSADKGAAARAA